MNKEEIAKEFSKNFDWSSCADDTEITCVCGKRRRGKGKLKLTLPDRFMVAEKPCSNCGSILLHGIHHPQELFTIGKPE